MPSKKRKIEIYSADCSLCNEVIEQVRKAACPSCEIEVLDMSEYNLQARASALGIKSVPAVVIDGQLASCCSGAGVDLEVLKSAGLGQTIRTET